MSDLLKLLAEPFYRLSLRFRLSVLFVVIFGTTTAIFTFTVFQSMSEALQKDFDDALFNYAVDVADTITLGPRGDLKFPTLRVESGKILPFPLGNALIQVRHVSGQVLARVGDFGSFNPPYKADFKKIETGEEASFRTIDSSEEIPEAEADTYRIIGYPLDNARSPQLLLQIAVPMTLLETQIQRRLNFLQFGIPLVLLIATLGGLFISSRALAPVNQIIRTAQEIDVEEMGQRVPVPKTRDELQKLAQTVNEMLDRIERSFQSQERFVADASHQLLTPLTILRGELELLGKQANMPVEVQNFVSSGLQEVDALSRVVQDMLLLARVDAGLGAFKMQEIYLSDLLLDLLPRYEKYARAKGVSLKFDLTGDDRDRKPVRGDVDLLSHLFGNLIENAIKYSPGKTTVTLNLQWTSESIVFQVRDSGPGLPDGSADRLFERFHRGAGAEQKTQGFGLGLSIAQKIAHLHHSRIEARNNFDGGATFQIEIKNI